MPESGAILITRTLQGGLSKAGPRPVLGAMKNSEPSCLLLAAPVYLHPCSAPFRSRHHNLCELHDTTKLGHRT